MARAQKQKVRQARLPAVPRASVVAMTPSGAKGSWSTWTVTW
jgi:hypothetical protein